VAVGWTEVPKRKYFSGQQSGLLGCASGATLPGSRAGNLARAELSGDGRAQDSDTRAKAREVVSGDEKVEFDGAGGRISSLYSG
jgi:hypothetical protein